jgi:hypothetical protein
MTTKWKIAAGAVGVSPFETVKKIVEFKKKFVKTKTSSNQRVARGDPVRISF